MNQAPNRRVEPVSDEFDPDELFDPSRTAQPVAALALTVAPLLAVVGLAGWLRLLSGVPLDPPPGPSAGGLVLDALLIVLFASSHSLLARGFGRRWLNRPFGPTGERPLYVLVAGATLTLLALAWRTSGPVLWDLQGVPKMIVRAIQLGGGLLALWASLVMGLGRTLGIAQLRAMERGVQPPPPEFVALPPFRWVRHPVSLGLLVLLAAQHEVTLDRLLLAAGLGIWTLIVTPFEERDAEITFGRAYSEYKRRTRRWIPGPRRTSDA